MSETTPVRCPWHGIDDAVYARYHDEEWGVPHCDERRLFEKMVLESFQSGLSWLTILRKRDNFRRAFHGFDPNRIARYGEKDFARLMDDAGIVRNRLKIEATIANATAYLDLEREGGLAPLLVAVSAGRPRQPRARKFLGYSGADGNLEADRESVEGARLPFPRPHHRLRLHAVNRHGQRSPRRLPSAQTMRRVAAEIQGPCLKGMLTPAVEASPADMTSVPSTLTICEQETGAEVRRVSSRDRSFGNCRGDADRPDRGDVATYIPELAARRS